MSFYTLRIGFEIIPAFENISIAPEYFDNTAEEEDVDEDDEEGGDGEEENAATIVHPAVDRVVAVPDHINLFNNAMILGMSTVQSTKH